MSSIKVQQRIIEDMESVKYTTGALRDISAIELRHLRDQFKQNDLFYTELQDLYQVVWKMADAINRLDFLDQRDQQPALYVAYTTNRHFYGLLNYDVMRAFLEQTNTDSDCLVIGNTGKEIWDNGDQPKRAAVDFLSFKGDTPDKDEVRLFLERSAGYESVVVFYPSFVSVYQQKANAIDVTFRPAQAQSAESELEERPQYFLEPDIEQMISFFNSQVRYMLFERMLLESELSRVAARLVRMDMAEHNTTNMLKRENAELRRAYRSFSSSRMLETMVGYLQWHKTSI